MVDKEKMPSKQDWERVFRKYQNSNSLPFESIEVGSLSAGFINNNMKIIGYRNPEEDVVKDLKWSDGDWKAEEREIGGLSWYPAGLNEIDNMILAEYYNMLEGSGIQKYLNRLLRIIHL